ncbi:unnamed protein product, partial [Mesorhabditis belari]|uniref:RING-type domain-containing protein n=1 Tax=Mesorhabditis belari TaxID=2138241 RepID=A0AAF3EBL9_9BILA
MWTSLLILFMHFCYTFQDMLKCQTGGNLNGTITTMTGASLPKQTLRKISTLAGVKTGCQKSLLIAPPNPNDYGYIIICDPACENCSQPSLAKTNASYLLILQPATDASPFVDQFTTFTLYQAMSTGALESFDYCTFDGIQADSNDALRSFSKTSVLFVSISFIILMVISLAWLVFYYVQRFRYAHAKDRLQRRLFNAAKKALARIPTRTLKSGDCELDTDCPVCIDPYVIGDIVRTLPCRHVFHKTCIDPWLLEHRTCPMCKGDILKAFGYQVTCSSEGSRGEERDVGTRGESPEPPSAASDSAVFTYPPQLDHHDPFHFTPNSSPQLVLNNSNAKSFVVPLSVHSKASTVPQREVVLEAAPERSTRSEGRSCSAGEPGPSRIRSATQGQLVNLVQVRSRSMSVARAATFRGRMEAQNGGVGFKEVDTPNNEAKVRSENSLLMSHLCFFCPLDGIFAENLIIRAQKAINDNHQIDPELFLNEDNLTKIEWLLSVSPFGEKIRKETIFDVEESILEIGPRLSMKTSFCTNALAVLNAVEIRNVSRIERSIRYLLHKSVAKRIPHQRLLELLGDRMTECIYEGKPNFEQTAIKEPFTEIRLLSNPNALKEANEKLGLAFDSSDLDYYKDLFINKLKRNPTDVELFDLAQSDSEHSRHWFFRGKLFIDGELRGESLMDSIRGTQKFSNQNNLIAFSDNSSVIKGFEKVPLMLPNDPTIASELSISTRSRHLLYTAETHNFPTAVCPFQGATTGTGGRIRDVHATGRGAHEIAAVAGYSFGNLHLPGYEMPWEEPEVYPSGFAHPRQICIEASDGASDYGNKFGEPVLCGFARSFGQRLPSGERCEYLKPIMFSGGIGSIDEEYLKKKGADAGQLLAKIGGPVYRIGVGGGAASSQAVQGDRESVLDFGAVQRGDAEMEQKVHRVVRSCVEMNSADNPILSIHDQGAGGNGNVLKELCEGAGGEIFADFFELGDHTISIRELWTAEYQENDAILLDPTKKEIIEKISKREKCPVNIVGKVTGNQKVILHDFSNSATQKLPVDFDLSILSDREKKEFHQNSLPILTSPLKIVDSLTISSALGLVLRLPSVASKRYLTTKVDRSVTGLVARQQCCGPLHTPLADVAVVALSYFSLAGHKSRHISAFEH